MVIWFVVVLVLLSVPLLPFVLPLADLKWNAVFELSARMTEFQRAEKRKAIGRNLAASTEPAPSPDELEDPSKQFDAARKMWPFIFSRKALLPVKLAALELLVSVGATQLPLKELFTIVKRLVLV